MSAQSHIVIAGDRHRVAVDPYQKGGQYSRYSACCMPAEEPSIPQLPVESPSCRPIMDRPCSNMRGACMITMDHACHRQSLVHLKVV